MTDAHHDRDKFFLGGRDLEMLTIRQLLDEHLPGCYVDHELSWGATAVHYADEINEALAEGLRVVLIELELGHDDPWRDEIAAGRVVIVDHHDERAGADQPTALEQIFALLDLPRAAWKRWHVLVAANDRGHVFELQAMGATTEEIVQVRAADRSSQGATPEEEASAREAIGRREMLLDGDLTVVRLPHGRTSTAADAMETALGGPGYHNLLILTPGGATFFGDGTAVQALHARLPNSYYGGALPERGFWGIDGEVTLDELVATIQIANSK
ncbi:MAG: hypothetical protein O3C40_22150 [Planctomycetota bacterium]|nr:hypothetical protein [Planctomycetota bacterium]